MARIRLFVDDIEVTDDIFLEEEHKAVAIEKWYDRHRREWVLYPIDSEGNQLREATYGFSKVEANALQKELAVEYGL